MSNDQSLKRIFSGLNANKYPTLGKFLPAFSKQKVVFSTKPDEVSNNDTDLELADQLIKQTLINRDHAVIQDPVAIQDPTNNAQSSARAKEILRSETTDALPITELDAESQLESNLNAETSDNIESSAEFPQEIIANPELAELSKEIQEVSKETKEQREQALIKEKQQEIDNLATEVTTPVAISDKPVVVLPITAKSKEEAKFKTTKYSVRWLLEWCEKIAKMFSGAVVYKEEVDYE